MIYESRGQANQDKFVLDVLGHKRDGTFLEIGSNNPVEINNTYALESVFNWRGLGVDNSGESMEAWEKRRESHFYLTDASQPQNWQAALAQAELPTDRISYLSLDIDGATLACLRCLPLYELRFDVITVETDAYRNGPEYRQAILDILEKHDYLVLCPDVMDQGLSFEAWAVDPKTVDMPRAEKFRRSTPTEWKEFWR